MQRIAADLSVVPLDLPRVRLEDVLDRLNAPPSSSVESLLAADVQRSAELLDDAIAGYEKALSNAEAGRLDTLSLRLKLADCYQRSSRTDRVLAVLAPLGDELLPPEWRARVLTQTGWARLYLGDAEACVRDCAEAVRLLNPTHHHHDVARASRRLGYALKWTGHLSEAEDAFRDALAAAKRVSDREELGLCLHALGNLSRHRGLYNQAISFHELSLAINTERGDAALIAKDLCSIGLAALYAGDWKRAIQTLDQSQKICSGLGLRRGVLLVELTLCRLHRRRGEAGVAATLAERASVRAREIADSRAEVLALEERGDIAWELGDTIGAASHYDNAWQRALDIAPRGDLVYELAWRRARVALAEGRLPEAEGLALNALNLAEQNADLREAASALRVLSQVQVRLGRLVEAVTSLETALGQVRSIQAPFEAAETHEAFSDLAGQGMPLRPTSALAHLFEARRLYAQLGAKVGEGRVEAKIALFQEQVLGEAQSSAVEDRAVMVPLNGVIARDGHMQQLLARAMELAETDATVLLQGSTGTGKEVLARAMHEQGKGAQQPFVPVNCAALPTQLLESELFGHRRGSFTGAEQDRVGLFEAAGQGTVFLDEIDKAPPEFQTKLLRVIEDRRVRPVGSSKETVFEARILCATNRDLRELATAGRFLPDLYYRLAAFRLVIPDLRERPDDLWALVEHYLSVAKKRFGARRYRLTSAARAALAAHDWPGNVRELRNVLEAAAFFTRKSGIIDRDDLPPEIGIGSNETVSLSQRIETLERREIALALRRARGVKALAAQMLGVSRKGLLDRLRRLGME